MNGLSVYIENEEMFEKYQNIVRFVLHRATTDVASTCELWNIVENKKDFINFQLMQEIPKMTELWEFLNAYYVGIHLLKSAMTLTIDPFANVGVK